MRPSWQDGPEFLFGFNGRYRAARRRARVLGSAVFQWIWLWQQGDSVSWMRKTRKNVCISFVYPNYPKEAPERTTGCIFTWLWVCWSSLKDLFMCALMSKEKMKSVFRNQRENMRKKLEKITKFLICALECSSSLEAVTTTWQFLGPATPSSPLQR